MAGGRVVPLFLTLTGVRLDFAFVGFDLMVPFSGAVYLMADEAQPHLSVRKKGIVSIVEFSDRKILDELSIAEIGDELTGLAAEQTNPKVLLSFKNVEHLSSAALGMLIKLNKEVAAKGGTLKLSDITPQIFEVFKITRLNKLFDIHETTEKAISTF